MSKITNKNNNIDPHCPSWQRMRPAALFDNTLLLISNKSMILIDQIYGLIFANRSEKESQISFSTSCETS